MICHFAYQFPKIAGEFLDRAQGLKRSFREETITDVLMGAMVAFRPLGVDVVFSDEPRTGADMEWTFVRDDGSRCFRLLIQAKKLYGNGKYWTRRSYPEIFHTVKTTARLQSDYLVSTASQSPATFPLYIFYTHQSVCNMAAKSNQSIEGVSFVSGTFINDLVKKKTCGALKATEASSLSVIQPEMFPISHLLCGAVLPRRSGLPGPGVIYFVDDGIGIALSRVPTPEEVRARLVEILGSDAGVPEVKPLIDLPALQVGQLSLDHFEESIAGPPRVRVTFRSPGLTEEARSR